jgi:microcystin-dependent protein
MSEPFIGEIRIVSFGRIPQGWMACDGRLLQIARYPDFYAILGATYGGNGTTTFALPDLRGRTPVHRGEGPGLPAVAIGEKGGVETVTLEERHLPAHSHGIAVTGSPGNTAQPASARWAATGIDPAYATASSGAMGPVVGTAGASQPHENMPPYQVVLFIIAFQGLFPQR